MTIDKTDPRLTALVLGELPYAEAAELRTQIENDPELAAEVAALRQTAEMLKQELAAESAPGLAAERKRRIVSSVPDSWIRREFGGPRFSLAAVLVVCAGTCVLASLMLPSLQRARSEARHQLSAPLGEVLPLKKEYRELSHEELSPKRYAPEPTVRTDDVEAAKEQVGVGDYSEVNVPKPDVQREISLAERSDLEIPGPGDESKPGSRPAATPQPVRAGGVADGPASVDFSDHDGGLAMGVMALEGAGHRDRARADKRDMRIRTQTDQLMRDAENNAWSPSIEHYDAIEDNAFKRVADHPLSTFSIDVDTASYSNVRRFLSQGRLPPRDAVRIEELLNYFSYDYAPPTDGSPFAAHVAVAACPWNPEHRLARIALKGRVISERERPDCNLVFLIDVSGSMKSENKLPLVKAGLRQLVERLDGHDRVALAVYAGASGLVLPSTPADRKSEILAALDQLSAGGSTNGGAGIELAYRVAGENFIRGGANRVILCTDGDFNVGVTQSGELTELIEEKAKTGVFLSVLGFGMGNYKDGTLEKLADKGNGNYAYIDTQREARKVLVEQMTGTLVTIAKDVKIQVEFNPTQVAEYRLIGYENRRLAKEDFNNDAKDAGEIGAGHAVTALYELAPAGRGGDRPTVDPLRYQQTAPMSSADRSGELLLLKLRFKAPDGDRSTLREYPVRDSGVDFAPADPDFKFAAAVAEFGFLLRQSKQRGNATYESVLELARAGQGADGSGYRREFIELVEKARQLSGGREEE